jgi:RHS repeat-associated protein
LQFDKTGSGTVADTDLSHRYLWGPMVDQLLTDEQVTSVGSEGEVLWAMADNIGSVRDVIDSNADLRIHRQFDTFGNIVDEAHFDTSGDPVSSTDPEFVTVGFGFTGRWRDPNTGLQNNLNRWYDSKTGSWPSEDPIGFAADDPNLRRYANNRPLDQIDPTGLVGGYEQGG